MTARSFIVPGRAVPWGVTTFRGMIRPKSEVRAWQKEVYYAARAALDLRQYEGPIRMDAVVVIQRPKSRSRTAPERFIPHTVKPDRDNFGKALQDALVRSRDELQPILADDCTVWVGEIAKVWAPVGVGSFVVVSLEPVDDAEDELDRMGLLDVVRFGAEKYFER